MKNIFLLLIFINSFTLPSFMTGLGYDTSVWFTQLSNEEEVEKLSLSVVEIAEVKEIYNIRNFSQKENSVKKYFSESVSLRLKELYYSVQTPPPDSYLI